MTAAPQAVTDEEIVELFRANEFKCARSRQHLDDFSLTAYRTLRALIASGEIFSRVAEFGRPVDRKNLGWLESEAVHEITTEMIGNGAGLFRRSILAGNWNPHGGASLQTYFNNSCILCFPNAYRRVVSRIEFWTNETPDVTDLNEILDDAAREKRRTSEAAADRDMARRVLRNVPPTVQEILLYVSEGYTAKEIARKLGTTDRAVQGQLQRLRKGLADLERGA